MSLAFALGTLAAADTNGLPLMPRPIAVTNYKDGETVRYPLVLLRGALTDQSLKAVRVVNESSTLGSREMAGLAHQGRFKAFAELVPGENRLTVRAGKEQAVLVLSYEPQTNPYKVRAVHFTDNTGDPTYESQSRDDPQDYRAKWDAGLKLLQTFTADEMHRHGHGRKTFNLELGQDGKVIVHIVKDRRGFDELQKLNGLHAYGSAAGAIHQQLPRGPFKHLVCVAFSRHVKGTGKATAYGALGGGDVALMGGACFYTWPTGVTDITRTFTSDAPINKDEFHADDIGRFAVWATAATTLGAGLHELGHAFTLPHPRRHYHGIMGRGGDRLNRYVGFFDPPSRWHRDFREFKPDTEPYWSEVSAAALAPSRWFALDSREYTERNSIRFAIDPETAELVFRSDDGLAFAGVEMPGAAEKFDPRAGLALLPKELRVPLVEIMTQHKTSRLTVRAVDGMGHYRHVALRELLEFRSNLTTGKPVKASAAHPNHPPERAVDGLANRKSYWDADPYPQWLQVDLGKAVKLDRMQPFFYWDGRRYYQYTIEVSANGTDWTQVVDRSATAEKTTSEGELHAIQPVEARYVRVNMLKNSANPGVHISELRVFEPGQPLTDANDPFEEIRQLLRGPYVQRWQLSTVTVPRRDASAFPDLSDERRKQILESAQAAERTVLPMLRNELVDLAKAFPDGLKEKVGYAVRTIRAKEPREVKIIAGGDGSLRLWVDGRLAVEAPAKGRKRRPDTETAMVALRPGENTLLLEASGSFSLRLEDKDGHDLQLTDNGQLVAMGEAWGE